MALFTGVRGRGVLRSPGELSLLGADSAGIVRGRQRGAALSGSRVLPHDAVDPALLQREVDRLHQVLDLFE